MVDIEDPDSNRPRQSVLLSILPTKEFATSRKGSLLIAEVVRNDQRNHRWDEPNLFLCCCFRLMRTEVKARCVLFIWLNMAAMALRSFNAHFTQLQQTAPTVIRIVGQSVPVTRFPLVTGGAARVYKQLWSKLIKLGILIATFLLDHGHTAQRHSLLTVLHHEWPNCMTELLSASQCCVNVCIINLKSIELPFSSLFK